MGIRKPQQKNRGSCRAIVQDAIQGIRVTRLGSRVYSNVITDQVDPHGRPYLWIGGQGPTWAREDGSDHNAVDEGYVSLTPLMVDLTHYGLLNEMKHLEKDTDTDQEDQ